MILPSPRLRAKLRGLHVALALAVCGAPGWAQAVREYLLYPNLKGGIDSPPEETVFISSKLDDAGFNRVVRKVSWPIVTVYRPAPAANRGIALIVCPGGGYASLVIDREGHALGRHFQARGLTVAVLKYRLPQPPSADGSLPRSQEDALTAMRFMRAHASEWNVRADRVGILGCSAGGHLAGSLAFLGDARDGGRADFVVLLYPVVLMEGPFAHVGSRRNLLGPEPSAAEKAEFSLDQRVQPGWPPYFLTYAANDDRVPVQNSERLAEALPAARVPVELRIVKQGGLGYGLGLDPESRLWPDRFIAWLEETLP